MNTKEKTIIKQYLPEYDPVITLKNSKDYKRLFQIFFFLLKKIAFEDLKLLKISSETYSNRHNHIKLLEEAGYKKMNKQNRKNSVLHELIYNS